MVVCLVEALKIQNRSEIRKYVKLCNSDKTLDFTLFTVKKVNF